MVSEHQEGTLDRRMQVRAIEEHKEEADPVAAEEEVVVGEVATPPKMMNVRVYSQQTRVPVRMAVLSSLYLIPRTK